MSSEHIFVGRNDDLNKFDQIVVSPKGQAIVVVGQAGMGKTMLVNRMAARAAQRGDLRCGILRYEVTPSDSPAGTMEQMIDDAFEGAKVVERSLEATERRSKQWEAVMKIFPRGAALVDLVNSLARDPKRNTRDQLIERLNLISRRMPECARLIFIVDPEKNMQHNSQDDWRLVVRDLPDKVLFLFAQRPDDVLISSRDFMELENVRRIPDERLDGLDDGSVDELIDTRRTELPVSTIEAWNVVKRYDGHPRAVSAALSLIAAGRPINDLPGDPSGICETQWNQVCDKHGKEAMKLFEAHAILEVAVPDDVVEAVSGVGSTARRALLANAYVGSLFRQEPDGRKIYHVLLTDHIRGQVSDADSETYHQRAIAAYYDRLTADVRPDALAAQRLPEHALAIGGPQAFVDTVIKCTPPLLTLGLLDALFSMSHQALDTFVSVGTQEEAVVRGNLAIVYRTRGELDLAEAMHRRAAELFEQLGHLQGLGSQYSALGVIHQARGALDMAEVMYRRALGIYGQLGHLDCMAMQYGNLGFICQVRGDLDQAEVMFRKALKINQQLCDREGMANDYRGLGIVFLARGDPEEAEAMHRKALQMHEELGNLRGMAIEFGNLGTVFFEHGDLDQADAMYTKALDIDEQLGHPEGVAKHIANRGLICRRRGDLAEAERTFCKALRIFERIGHCECIANMYGNLGAVRAERGDLAHARDYWAKARKLYAKIGMPHMVEKIQAAAEGLPPEEP